MVCSKRDISPSEGHFGVKTIMAAILKCRSNRSAQNYPLQRALRNEGFRRVQLMDTSGPHDPLRWFFAWWYRSPCKNCVQGGKIHFFWRGSPGIIHNLRAKYHVIGIASRGNSVRVAQFREKTTDLATLESPFQLHFRYHWLICCFRQCCQLSNFVAKFSNFSDYPSYIIFQKHLATNLAIFF